MSKLKIELENALAAHSGAGKEGKKLLEDLFGAEIFIPKSITDRVKTFEDACKVVGVDPDDVLPFSDAENNDQKAINAFAKLRVIAKALNEGWEPDWTNSNQNKYTPYLKANPSGSGFSCSDYGLWYAVTCVGSRLCFKTSDLAMYAATQFEGIYNDFFLI